VRTFRAKLFSLDGTPNAQGELFAPGAVNNFGAEVVLRNQSGKVIGTAKVVRANKGEEGVYAEGTVLDDDVPGGPAFFTAGAVVYDCDHRFNEKNEVIATRLNEAEIFEVKAVVKHPDARVAPVKVPFLPHDGAGTEPEE
jgi:hypothetical protein